MADTVIITDEDERYPDMSLAWNRQDRPRDFQWAGRHWQVYTEGMGFKFVAVSEPGMESYGSLSTNRLGR